MMACCVGRFVAHRLPFMLFFSPYYLDFGRPAPQSLQQEVQSPSVEDEGGSEDEVDGNRAREISGDDPGEQDQPT